MNDDDDGTSPMSFPATKRCLLNLLQNPNFRFFGKPFPQIWSDYYKHVVAMFWWGHHHSWQMQLGYEKLAIFRPYV